MALATSILLPESRFRRKSFRIHTCGKCVCKPFGMHTYGAKDLKSFRMHTSDKRGEGGYPQPPTPAFQRQPKDLHHLADTAWLASQYSERRPSSFSRTQAMILSKPSSRPTRGDQPSTRWTFRVSET